MLQKRPFSNSEQALDIKICTQRQDSSFTGLSHNFGTPAVYFIINHISIITININIFVWNFLLIFFEISCYYYLLNNLCQLKFISQIRDLITFESISSIATT